MELYQLRYFVKVAEIEHMTRAARELNLSEPALSRTIRQLETELDTKLFERRGRSLVLTESGALLLTRSRDLLMSVGDMQAEVRGVHQRRRPVRLVARAAAGLLPELLEGFCTAHPDIQVSVIQNDNDIIRSQEYDLMIGGSIIQPPKYSSTVLLDDPFTVLLPRDHPLAVQRSIRLEQLNGQAMIGLTPNRFISVTLRQLLEECGVQVENHLYSDDGLMIRNLVERGLGFAILPEFTLRDIDKQNLCELPIEDAIPCLHLVLSWRPDAYHSEAVQTFRRFTIRYFQELVQK